MKSEKDNLENKLEKHRETFKRYEPYICLHCAFSFPKAFTLIKLSKDKKHVDIMCPLCGSNQIVPVNDLIDKSESLKDYIKQFKLFFPSDKI